MEIGFFFGLFWIIHLPHITVIIRHFLLKKETSLRGTKRVAPMFNRFKKLETKMSIKFHKSTPSRSDALSMK